MTEEQYVQSRWQLVHCSRQSGRVWVQDVNVHWSDFASWAEAAEFTRQREEKIRELKIEIDWVTGFSAFADHSLYGPARIRILARLETALAELKKGMKS